MHAAAAMPIEHNLQHTSFLLIDRGYAPISSTTSRNSGLVKVVRTAANQCMVAQRFDLLGLNVDGALSCLNRAFDNEEIFLRDEQPELLKKRRSDDCIRDAR